MSDEPAGGTKYRDLFTALAAPFEPHQVKTIEKGGRKIRYARARVYQNRLDRVLGPENWWDDFHPFENSVLCRLTVRLPDGQLLTKCDAGGYAGMADQGDDDKSGYSDAFKRACVKFGVGRYLYDDGVAFDEAPAAAPAPGPGNDSIPSPNGTPPDRSPYAGRTPTTGKALYAWCRDTEAATGTGLVKYLDGWGKLRGFPPRFADWTAEQVNEGHDEACRKLDSLPKPPAAPAEPAPLTSPNAVVLLPDPPMTGKALYAKVKDLEKDHGGMIADLNAWAKKQGRTEKMVGWPADFLRFAWVWVSERVNGPAPDACPPAAGAGPPLSVEELRRGLWGWCHRTVCRLYHVPDGENPDERRVWEELDRVTGLSSPGRTVGDMKQLTNVDDLLCLIELAKQRFKEVELGKVAF